MKKKIFSCFLVLIILSVFCLLTGCASYQYTVKYFREIPDGTYVEYKIDKFSTDKEVLNYEPEEIEHYDVNYNKSKLTGDLTSDVPVVIEVYYDAKRYTVKFEIGELELVSGELTQKIFYGEDAVAPVVKDSKKGKFVSWDCEFTNVSSDLVVKAQCDTNANVTIYHKFENLDGTYTTKEYQKLVVDASKGSYSFTPSEIKHYVINTSKSELSCEINVGESKEITVCYDRKEYTVKFELNGLDLQSGSLEQKVKYGDKAIAPVTSNNSKSEFVSWDKDFSNIEADITIKAVVNNEAKVNVITYKEDINGEYKKEKEETILVSTTNDTYKYEVESVSYFLFNEEKSTLTVTPNILKTETIIIYYDREVYKVEFNLNGLDLVSGDLVQNVKYGASAVAPVTKDNEKCRFVNWDSKIDEINGNITINAIVTTDAEVKVIVYKENINGEYIIDSETSINVDTKKGDYTYSASSIEHYTINENKSVLKVTPSLTKVKSILVYYDLTRYTVKFNIAGLNHIGGGALEQTVPYGGKAVAPEVSGTRTSVFLNWNKTFENITSDTTIEAVCSSDSTVNITSYYENITGGYSMGETKQITVSALPETYTYTPVVENNYDVNKSLSSTSCSLYAGKEQTISIYYDLKRYTVTFKFEKLNLVSGDITQIIPHGGSAIAPVLENTETVIFSRWDVDFSNVTSNLTVNAVLDVYNPIASRSDLECIALDLSANYILTEDINLSSGVWTPLGTFTGKFLGNGHTITGLTFSGQNETGIFTTNKGVIDGLILKDCSASFSIHNGNGWGVSNAFVANKNEGTIKNCRVIGSNSFTYTSSISYEIGCYSESAFIHYNWSNTFRAGAYASYNYGIIENCSIEGALNFTVKADLYYKFNTWLYTHVGSGSFTITSYGVFGGFAAENYGNIEKCMSNANIKSTSISKAVSETSGSGRNDVYSYTNATVGSVAGKNNNVINGCRTLVANLEYGSKSTNCSEAHANNSVTTDSSIKGLVGTNSGTITSSVATTS